MFRIQGEDDLEVLWEDGHRVFCRGWGRAATANSKDMLAVLAANEYPAASLLDSLAHEYALRSELDGAWAVRPLELLREAGRTVLLLEDPGGEPLDRLLGAPMDTGHFLKLAIGIASALGKAHQRGLVHKDVKPANILVNCTDRQVRLFGFGIATRLPRERQAPEPPEVIAGSLAYMAPEQTGRMNRSIDSRSDLYALGVTFYQMLTAVLPFTASDPMEWVHCHIARRPIAPAERLNRIPNAVSAIVMRLLAKTPEERYQTAGGVERDLRRCLNAWEIGGRVDDFRIGEHDMPDRLLIPEKLYGREREVGILLASFDRIIKSGMPELMLVSGYSGIGKSSVVNELHKELVPPRGLFASGKFDQYKRDIPYATLAQAFQGLIRPLLGKSDAELMPWRDALRDALGANGQLMVTLIPELAPFLGPLPPVPEVPPQDAQRRFQLVFRRLLGVFARPEHPLALFLDDLQWLDAATLDLLEHLATQPELRHLLLVGAYRDNEVTPEHPLMQRLAAIRGAGGRVQEIVLEPLELEDVSRLVADALQCTTERAAPLARLVHAKTAGNPFFTIQFLTALAEEGLLVMYPDRGHWVWDLARIQAKEYTDNVVELMLGKVRRLPQGTQDALRQLACLGNSATTGTLALVRGGSEEELDVTLWEAVWAGLVLPQEGSYRFLHDRVQEAAYGLIPDGERATEHLRIGRLLAAHTKPEAITEHVFEIAGQLNRCTALITSAEEREQVAELNLIAGQRAKQSTAYASALTYLIAGRALLPQDAWERRHELTFALELHRAECEFLTGAVAEAETRLVELADRATALPELSAVTRLRMELFIAADRSDRAVEAALDYLGRVGHTWSAKPTQAEVKLEYERMWQQIGDRRIEALIDLPRMADPDACATMDVLTALAPPALHTDGNLLCLALCRMANLSLEHGNSDASCEAYVLLGVAVGPYFGDYSAAFRFGQLGLDLVEKLGQDRAKARVYMVFGSHGILWARHIQMGRPLLRKAFEAAQQSGDLTFAAYSRTHVISNLLASGEPLDEVQPEAEAGLDFVRQARFGLIVDRITGQLQLIRTLRGLTSSFGSFDDTEFEEGRFERHLEADPRLAIAACWYWIRKLQAYVFSGDHTSAEAAAAKAERLLWTSPAVFERAEYHFYAALAHAALYDARSAADASRHREVLGAHHRQLQIWAEYCPENFENRAQLIAAEIARIDGDEPTTMRLYEQAIRSARANEFVHNEALANELAARFYLARGFEPIAYLYLRNARHCYLRWEAVGKVRQLEELYPHLRESSGDPKITIGAPVDHLDLATVIKVSQAVSGEIVLEKLIDTLMRTAIEQAGAERGILILSRGTEQRIAAEGSTSGNAITVHLRDANVTAAELPESVLHHVLRSRESVILDDAASQFSFADDPYIRKRRVRSVLCLPLLNQARLIGVLYLENNLAPRVFVPARTSVLKLLASQAAIALENTRLYRDLAEREKKIGRLVDANIIGIFMGNLEGRIFEANDALLRIVGYDREDLLSGRISWMDLTPPEWRERDALAIEELKATGAMSPYEKEYFHKDGSRVSVLIGSALFEEGGSQGVAFVLDLTERKRAEAEASESERRYREAQMELAHANRVAAMGQLTASIAHEVRQPLSAVKMNGNTALRWLARDPPEIDEVRQSIENVVLDANRANDVINRIHGLVRKVAPNKDTLDINETILEVVALTRAEAAKHGVVVHKQLEHELPGIRGDRVQLQQVMINLIINAIQSMSSFDGARELRVSTRHIESEGIRIAVRDSGPGLGTGTLSHLFRPFYTTKPGGMGMGLSISRSIIEDHGGRLWASEHEATGALFEFTIPVTPLDRGGEE